MSGHAVDTHLLQDATFDQYGCESGCTLAVVNNTLAQQLCVELGIEDLEQNTFKYESTALVHSCRTGGCLRSCTSI